MRNSWVTRLMIALTFSVVAFCYGQIFQPASNWPMYYASAALIDFNFVFLLKVFGRNSLVHDLQNINYTSVIVHFVGWIMYMSYLPPIGYNAMLHSLILMQWGRLIWVGPHDRNSGNYFVFDMVLHPHRGCRQRTSREANL